jgi:hypothetical protein
MKMNIMLLYCKRPVVKWVNMNDAVKLVICDEWNLSVQTRVIMKTDDRSESIIYDRINFR